MDQTTSVSYDNYAGAEGSSTLTNKIVVQQPIGIRIVKIDQEGHRLNGAAFTLHRGADNGDEIGTYTSRNNGTEDGFVYENSNIGDGTFTLVESGPPGGYTAAANVTITVADGRIDVQGVSSGHVHREGNTYVIEVMNVRQNGFELTSTGGSGTAAYYAAGTALVLGAGAAAGVQLRRRKRRG